MGRKRSGACLAVTVLVLALAGCSGGDGDAERTREALDFSLAVERITDRVDGDATAALTALNQAADKSLEPRRASAVLDRRAGAIQAAAMRLGRLDSSRRAGRRPTPWSCRRRAPPIRPPSMSPCPAASDRLVRAGTGLEAKRPGDRHGRGDRRLEGHVDGGKVPEGEAAYLRFEGEADDSGDYAFRSGTYSRKFNRLVPTSSSARSTRA